MYWYEEKSAVDTPVISTRVRFARNLEKVPFPCRLSAEGKKKVMETVKKATEEKLSEEKPMILDFSSLGESERGTYVETRLASPGLLKAGKGAGLVLSGDGEISMMINEEDHLRIQALLGGFALEKAYERAFSWAKKLEEAIPFAYQEGLGYLTSCPTNLGAAMRISVMIHLPALEALGRIPALVRALGNAGFTVRGMMGEGSGAQGSIYQVSNQMSQAASPEEIMKKFDTVIREVISQEKKATEERLRHEREKIEDAVSRAVGTLSFARIMSYGEFISLYSLVRFGRAAKIPIAEKGRELDRLFIELMPSPMILKDARLADPALRDAERAQQLRRAFQNEA